MLNSVREIRWEFASTLNFSVHQGLKAGGGCAAAPTQWYVTAPDTPNTQEPVPVGAVGQSRGMAGAGVGQDMAQIIEQRLGQGYVPGSVGG